MADVTLPLWVEYAKALGPTFVALVAACIAGTIAYRQWRTAQNKLKLDLFERRMTLYVTALDLIHGRWPEEEEDFWAIQRCAKTLESARWLLNTKTHVELEKLVVRMENRRSRVEKVKVLQPEERIEHWKREVNLNEGEQQALTRLFEPFLNIRH